MDRGYFALWRKLQDHPFWKEKREFSKAEAWIDILWEVQHNKEPVEVTLGMTRLICNYGESLKSLDTWARRWGWNKSKVRRFFKLLSNMNQVQIKSVQKSTRITVLNYSQYDPRRNDSDTQATRKKTTATPDKNVKNIKKVKITKKTYGEFNNVFLSDDEFKSLNERFNGTLSVKLENLSGYVASTGKKYKSHYHTILNWARKENVNTQIPNPSPSGTCNLCEHLRQCPNKTTKSQACERYKGGVAL